ncbi:MAG: hypothetical protein HFE57_05350 [Firmicutes bacterium]|jgi:hypothetical protein|nr:hypothetical protein [Bacillota bacterium]
MKRYFALLFIIFTLTINTTVSAKTFVDINTVPWQGAKSYIYEAVELGIMNGDNKTQKFRPRDNVTYCELVQTMYNVLKKTDYLCGRCDTEEMIEDWRDVLEFFNIPKWAYESVSYSLRHGFVTVADIPNFMEGKKQQYANRENTAVAFGKAVALAYDLDFNTSISYYDKNQIASTSAPYVGLLNDLGVMKGRSEHMFYPKQQINRAELAVLSCNAYNAMKKEQTIEIDEDDMIAWLFEQGLIEWLTPQVTTSDGWTVITAEGEATFFGDIDNKKTQTSNHNQNNRDYNDDNRQNNYNSSYDDDNRQNSYNNSYDDDNRQDSYNNRYDDERQDSYNNSYDDERQDNYNNSYDDDERQDNYNNRYDDDERQDSYNDRDDDDDNRQDSYNDRDDDDDNRQDSYNDRYDDDEKQDSYNDRYDDDEKQDSYNNRYDDDDNRQEDDDIQEDEPEEEFRQDETGDIYVVTK